MAKDRTIMNPHHLGIVIEKDLLMDLRRKANATDDSVSKIVRKALTKYMEFLDGDDI